MACEDSLNNIGDLPLLIGSSPDTNEATVASSRSEGFKVAGIKPDDGGKRESISRGIQACAEEGEKTKSD